MQKPTQTKQSEQLNIQENAENNHKQNYPLTEREPILGTPFTLIKTIDNHDPLTDRGDEQWFMVMGDYRITETTKTKEEQLDKLETEKWLLIMHIAIIAVKKIQHQMHTDYELMLDKAYAEKQNKDIRPYETESL